ncbi:ABC transporter permease [Clostridium estertheticum]|uniref:ABC transporter permease n=1 Tax=Clostridium estertheticum TaxID=238834 RepID=UPI0014794356|nr:ABC transporter permease [Clostridium estertheticum]MBZ9618262.1 ABC transporter permease [Clostridium estertheticum subsp. laramiense]WAG76236.1 ABC transporter permease [Clostridium estertheticum]
MRNVLRVIGAEIRKQYQYNFNSYSVYFSLLLWPILIFFNTYYTYKSFDLTKSIMFSGSINSNQSLIIFLITGFIGYNFFYSMVQSAWQMGSERQDGTLETVFLSPANRLAIAYGRSLGSLFQNVWMFSVFSFIVLIGSKNFNINNIIYIPIAFLILTLSATVWGGLMNVIFLFSRDAGILNNILDDPMEFFSGVSVPPSTFPLWAKAISTIFPLTYSLSLVRSILISSNAPSIDNVIKLSVSLILIFILTMLILKLAEKNARKSGNLTFY